MSTEQRLLGRMTLADCVNYLEKQIADATSVSGQIPALPEDDGTYFLQLVMDDGAATFTWESMGE